MALYLVSCRAFKYTYKFSTALQDIKIIRKLFWSYKEEEKLIGTCTDFTKLAATTKMI
jgi:hypothetical protein